MAPSGLGGHAPRTSSNSMGGAHFNGESYPLSKGTRHKRNFFKNLLTRFGTSQLPIPKDKRYFCLYFPYNGLAFVRVWWAHAKNS